MPPKKGGGKRGRKPGRVITSKGERTHAGVDVKEWQRTPVTLLSELMQRMKRPKPIYRNASCPAPNHRSRVVLPDPKSDRSKDIVLTTEQAFPSGQDAKHSVALLALFKLDGKRQYEMKLPEPYRTRWLHMTGRVDKAAAAASKAAAHVCEQCGKGFSKPHGLAQHVKREHPVKKKRPGEESDGEAEGSSAGGAGGAAAGGAGADGGAATTAAQAAPTATVTAAAPAAPPRPPVKLASGDIKISSRGRFMSDHDRAQAKREREQKVAQRRNRAEARERANPDCPVLMGEGNRRFVESALEESGFGLAWATERVRDGSSLTGGSAGSAADMSRCTATLRKFGFPKKASEEASRVACGDVTAAVEWLVLTLPESALPSGFDPRGKQYEIVVDKVGDVAELRRDPAARRLLDIGFNGADVRAVLKAADGAAWQAEALAHAHICESALGEFLTAAPTSGMPEEEAAECIEDEISSLTSMFTDDECKCDKDVDAEGVFRYRVKVGEVAGVPGTNWLEFRIDLNNAPPRQTLKYPNAVPVMWLMNKQLAPSARLGVAVAMVRHAHELRGAPMVHEMLMWVESQLSSALAVRAPPSFASTTSQRSAPGDSGTAGGAGGDGGGSDRRSGAGHTRGRGRGRPYRHQSAAALESKAKRLDSKLLELERGKGGDKWDRMQRQRASLPVSNFKEAILAAISKHQVVLLEGETGCGKTTQLPQFLLEDAISRGQGGHINIICTQPRRIAAVGVASRVADERCERVGDTVGYAIRGERKTSDNTRLLFATTGVLLRRLQDGLGDGAFSSLADVTHIVVDEVHERSVDTDFLLAVLTRAMAARPQLKVVLMSATMDVTVFTRYFGRVGSRIASTKARRGGAGGTEERFCPVIKVPGRTFPVRDLFLDDVVRRLDYSPPWFVQLERAREEARTSRTDGAQEALQRAEKRARAADGRIDFALAAAMVRHAARGEAAAGGSILVFLPGVGEIRRMERELQHSRVTPAAASADDPGALDWEAELEESAAVATDLHVLPLHGSLTPQDQRRVFQRAPRGKVKVVLATNIAETSITIDDITAVVDTGRVKETRFDAYNKMSCLVETWVSRASGMQRRGRAGRVREGTCYRLFTRDRWESFEEHTLPEIHRVPLEQLVLQVKMLNLEDPHAFLADTITPPPVAAVDTAVGLLTDIGALAPTKDRKLTPLGRHVARLPIDVRLAKLLIFGCILRCIDPVLTIAAVLSGRSPMMSPADKRDEARRAQERFVVKGSDHLTLCNAYNAFDAAGGQSAKRKLCRDHFLSYDGMREVHDLRRDFARTLADLGFIAGRGDERGSLLNECSSDIPVVQAALAAGLYPHIANIQWPSRKYVESTGGAIPASYKPGDLKYFVYGEGATADRNVREGRCFIHPSSVCFSETEFNVPYVVFTEKVQTSKVFLRTCSAIPTYALLLFGGEVQVQHEASTLTVGGPWIRFHASGIKVGILVRRLRLALADLLARKFEDPAMDVAGSRVIDGILKLLRTSGNG